MILKSRNNNECVGNCENGRQRLGIYLFTFISFLVLLKTENIYKI